jgi:hypothetical protein
MTREQFISDLSHWNSYLPMLWMALEATEGDVIEAGIGDGSTRKLHEYCQLRQRNLYSYESNLEWYRKFEDLIVNNETFAVHEIEYVGSNWEIMVARHREPIGVLFSDEAPGEMRKYNIAMFCNTAQVIIAHDAEESNDGGYKYSLLKPLFKYHKMHEFPGASTAAFSNFIDVSKWTV